MDIIWMVTVWIQMVIHTVSRGESNLKKVKQMRTMIILIKMLNLMNFVNCTSLITGYKS